MVQNIGGHKLNTFVLSEFEILVICILTVQSIFIIWQSKLITRIISRMPNFFELRTKDKLPNVKNEGFELYSILNKENHTCLFFIDSNCPICKGILPQLSKIAGEYELDFIIFNENENRETNQLLSQMPNYVKTYNNKMVYEKYLIRVVPQVIIINEDKIIEKRNMIHDIDVLKDLIGEYKKIATIRNERKVVND